MTDTQEQKQPEAVNAEVIVDAAISLITKAEIDMQIATAHAFPRSHSKFLRDVMSLATLTPEIAESCIYALPRGGKTLEGPSIRLAEMVASCYKNLRTGARVIYNDGKHVTAQGIVHDLEGNIMHTEEVRRSILQHEWKNGAKTGRMVPMNEDMQTVTGRAACAIAYRNAIFKVVPAALIEDVIEKVKGIIRGTAESLEPRRKKALQYFVDLGIKPEAIFEALGVKGEEDIDLDKFTLLRGMASAHRNGEAQLESLFPPPDSKSKADAATKATEEKLAKKTVKNTADKMADKVSGETGSGSVS